MYIPRSPILLLVFNRPDITQIVFDEIKRAQPKKLYIAADGPRAERPGEAALCEETRAIFNNIDWDCTVCKLFRTENLGCKEAVSSAITWFFYHEEEGIILEDDCLPARSFFWYCDSLLEKYRLDTRIRHIAGSSHQLGKKWGDGSIYFANQTHVWGWASWRRVWKDYDKDLMRYQEDEVAMQLANIFNDRFLIETWVNIFKAVKGGKVDTWDYQLAFANFFNNGLSVNPNINLITNIGYRGDATHTVHEQSPYANLPLEETDEIIYPKYILPQKSADYAVFNRDHNLDEQWRLYNLPRRQFKRLLKYSIKEWLSKK